MRQESLAFLRCLHCNSNHFACDPEAAMTDSVEVLEGVLRCGDCGERFPLRRGIPRFVPDSSYADSFGFQWQTHRKTQLDSYTGLPLSRNRLLQETGWNEDLSGQTILEAGSGAGRFTEVLLQTKAKVFSLDLSSAVDANWLNNGGNANLTLCQGSIFDIPFRRESFDKVFCLGVLQHTPNPERAFQSLVSHLRPGGEIVIDVYANGLRNRLQWKYLLRPITKHIRKDRLDHICRKLVPTLLPLDIASTRLFGRWASRLFPIASCQGLDLPYGLNVEWSVLDTLDYYSPTHDYPQASATVRRWFEEEGLTDVFVGHTPSGRSGFVGRGRRPI